MQAMELLERFVEEVRVVEPAAGRVFELLPDGRTTLVFRSLEGGRDGDVTICGPRTRAKSKAADHIVRAVIVQFKPGWSTPLLGVAASDVTDRHVHLREVWGRAGDALHHELLAARTSAEIVAALTRSLVACAPQIVESASARLARRAVRLLEGDEVRVETVAERLGVTARHLRRVFLECIGVGPKDYARTVRLHRALRLTRTSSDWGHIAVAAGYYDQAHLITDFRELVGVTPGAFARRSGGIGYLTAT